MRKKRKNPHEADRYEIDDARSLLIARRALKEHASEIEALRGWASGLNEYEINEGIKRLRSDGHAVAKALDDLCGALAQECMWSAFDAKRYVFFGIVPHVSSDERAFIEHPCLPGLNRIVLTLDPTLSPEDVRLIYRRARYDYLASAYAMRISVKHLQAALDAFDEGADLTWPQRYQAHLEKTCDAPDMQFATAGSFRSATEKAYRKILGRPPL